MRIGLLDVDGHNYPNLALMKLSRWHKEHGDIVEMYEPMFGEYDRVYMSKVFTHTSDWAYPIDCKDVIKGGTGYDVASALPWEIDHTQPDYSLYGNMIDKHTAYRISYERLHKQMPLVCGAEERGRDKALYGRGRDSH